MEAKNIKKIILGILLFVILVFMMGVAYFKLADKAVAGTKNYELSVIDEKGNTKKYSGNTEGNYLIDVLNELATNDDFSLEYSDSEYGPYVSAVNGLKAGVNAYWCVLENGEYSNYGVGDLPVKDGYKYVLKYEVYYEK